MCAMFPVVTFMVGSNVCSKFHKNMSILNPICDMGIVSYLQFRENIQKGYIFKSSNVSTLVLSQILCKS